MTEYDSIVAWWASSSGSKEFPVEHINPKTIKALFLNGNVELLRHILQQRFYDLSNKEDVNVFRDIVNNMEESGAERILICDCGDERQFSNIERILMLDSVEYDDLVVLRRMLAVELLLRAPFGGSYASDVLDVHLPYIKSNIRPKDYDNNDSPVQMLFAAIIEICDSNVIKEDYYITPLLSCVPSEAFSLVYSLAKIGFIQVLEDKILEISSDKRISKLHDFVLLCLNTPVSDKAETEDVIYYTEWLIEVGRAQRLSSEVSLSIVKHLIWNNSEPEARRERIGVCQDFLVTQWLCNSKSLSDLRSELLNLCEELGPNEKTLLDLMGEVGLLSSVEGREATAELNLDSPVTKYIWTTAYFAVPDVGSVDRTARLAFDMFYSIIRRMSEDTKCLLVLRNLGQGSGSSLKRFGIVFFSKLIETIYQERTTIAECRLKMLTKWCAEMLTEGRLMPTITKSEVEVITYNLLLFHWEPTLLQIFNDQLAKRDKSFWISYVLVANAGLENVISQLSEKTSDTRKENLLYSLYNQVVKNLRRDAILNNKNIFTVLKRKDSRPLIETILGELFSREQTGELLIFADRCIESYLLTSRIVSAYKFIIKQYSSLIGEHTLKCMFRPGTIFNWSTIVDSTMTVGEAMDMFTFGADTSLNNFQASRILMTKITTYISRNLKEYLWAVISIFTMTCGFTLCCILEFGREFYPDIIMIGEDNENRHLQIGNRNYHRVSSYGVSFTLHEEVEEPLIRPICTICKSEILEEVFRDQSKDHGLFVCGSCSSHADEASSFTKEMCNICLSEYSTEAPMFMLKCKHVFCSICMATMTANKTSACPSCKTPVSLGKTTIPISGEDVVKNYLASRRSSV